VKRKFRKIILLALVSSPLSAAVVQGVVLENSTGDRLAGSEVTLQPVGGNPLKTRSSSSGVFEFRNVPAGEYFVKSTRRGFLPAEYGQRQWNASGQPVAIQKDGVVTLTLRMLRFGGITGIVRDENEVGIPDQDVAAYTNTEPPRVVSRATSDDRGVFRISGLYPGSYLVRTTGNRDFDIAYIPTFSRQTLRVAEARPVEVYPDDDARDADIRPIRGNLFNLSGFVAPVADWQSFTIKVTLASDLGRRTSEGLGFRFGALPPGTYELYAEARENPPGTRFLGGYTELRIDRDIGNFALVMSQIRPISFSIQGGAGDAPEVMARRKDLTGTAMPDDLDVTAGRGALLPPGRWEILVIPPAGYYVQQFSPATRDGNSRPDGWNEVVVRNFTSVRVGLSGGASTLQGRVKASGDPAAWTPVFLEEWDPINRKRLMDLRETYADARGNYRFEGLAPGTYRVLATFDYRAPTAEMMDQAGAQAIDVTEHSDREMDLELFGNR
jgi:Carboxypeptidase regulatory-like domain